MLCFLCECEASYETLHTLGRDYQALLKACHVKWEHKHKSFEDMLKKRSKLRTDRSSHSLFSSVSITNIKV